MLTATREIRIEWGDCDPAGIVFFPRYFAWFDACTQGLFEVAGFPKQEMIKTFKVVGYPMVDTRARFLIPSKFGDIVTVQSTVTEFRRSSFNVQHRLLRGDALAVEGFETRVLVAREADDPDKIKGVPIPAEIIAAFQTAA